MHSSLIVKINPMKLLLALCIVICVMTGCHSSKQAAFVSPEGPQAFPGAEGFGKYATGGRGGKVLFVTNLEDAGEGSFRAAVESPMPAIIIFTISGTIHLKSEVRIASNKTVAGQTAPGDGICLADRSVVITGNNVIVRYLRFRLGDRYQNKGMVPGSGHDDAFTAVKRSNIIIDHCSFSWSTDEVLSVYDGDSTTLQWNIIAEPLNYSYHFEAGDKDFENHGYGGIWGGKHLTAHHNLFAHCISRNPRFAGTRSVNEEMVDYRNNVIYDWGHSNLYGGEGGKYNLVNNYYKPGPSTSKKVLSRIVNPWKSATIPFGKYYVNGNFVEGAPGITADNWQGVSLGEGNQKDSDIVRMQLPHQGIDIPTSPAITAFEDVMKYAGASKSRDLVDARITTEVKERTGKIIDVQGGFPHGTPYEQTKGAWPTLRSLPAPIDTDKDGMPDDWEISNGLNAMSDDANGFRLSRFYSNIEIYINSLIKF